MDMWGWTLKFLHFPFLFNGPLKSSVAHTKRFAVHISSKCTCFAPKSRCTEGICSDRPSVELCGVKPCAPPNLIHSAPLTKPSYAHLAFKGNGPGWAHQEEFCVAKTMSIGCPTLCMRIAIYLILVLFSCRTLFQCSAYLVLIVIIFRLINHNSRIKASAWIHHIVFSCIMNITSVQFYCLQLHQAQE